MNKSDVVRAVAVQNPKLRIVDIDKIVNDMFDVIGMSLSCDEDVKINGFGKFEVRVRKAIMRRNPKTGEPVSVPAKRSMGFVPSPVLKDRINRMPV